MTEAELRAGELQHADSKFEVREPLRVIRNCHQGLTANLPGTPCPPRTLVSKNQLRAISAQGKMLVRAMC